LIHLAHAKTRLPDDNLSHCKLGYCLLFIVGLNFPALNLTLRQTIFDFFPQIAHCLAIYINNIHFLKFFKLCYDKKK
jgi:hypothetical protein